MQSQKNWGKGQILNQSSGANGIPWWLSGKRGACQAGDTWSDPWVGKIPWRWEWQPTPVFWPGKRHGQRSLVATVHGVTELDRAEELSRNMRGADMTGFDGNMHME